jgi:hypothetical protein
MTLSWKKNPDSSWWSSTSTTYGQGMGLAMGVDQQWMQNHWLEGLSWSKCVVGVANKYTSTADQTKVRPCV